MTKTIAETIHLGKVLNLIEKKGFYYDYYQGTSEQGYDDKPMICADWNPKLMGRIYDWLEEKHGEEYHLDWSDEWMGCSECYKAVRSIYNSYGLEPSYLSSEDGIYCRECVDEAYHTGNGEEVIEWYRNELRALPSWTEEMVKALGYSCLEEDDYCCRVYETGLYPGQNADPEEVAKFVRENMPEHDFLFIIDDVGPFTIGWKIFIRKKGKAFEDDQEMIDAQVDLQLGHGSKNK